MTVTPQTPLTLGRNGRTPLTLSNRLVTSPMERNYGTRDGRVTEQYLDYLVERARAGAGMIHTEATFIRADGRGRTHQLGLHNDSVLRSHRRLTDAIHAAGSLAAVELNHGGRTVDPTVSGLRPVAPSPVPCHVSGGHVPHELTTDECRELIDAYAQAALRAHAAGYDAITLHGGHGYLIHQFMSSRTNQRTDEFANPTAFTNAVIAAVRAVVPSMVVGLRISVVEGVSDGMGAEETREVVGKLSLEQLDFLDLSAGCYEAGEWIVQSGEWARGLLSNYAHAYRDLNIPLGMAGRMNTAESVRQALADGTCDFVSLGRAVHADPDFLQNVLNGSAYRPCIACNVCIDNLGSGQVTCTVNPRVGRSRVPRQTTALNGQRILVVGAGPAGLTAALELARSGAQITIVDAGDRIGGDLSLAEQMKSTPEFPGFTSWMAREIDRYGMDLRLNERIDWNDPEVLESTGSRYDGLVLATGGFPVQPALSVAESATARVHPIRSWLRSDLPSLADSPPTHVTIWGADSVAMSVADTLADLGTEVLLIGGQTTIAPEAGRRAKILAVPRLESSSNVTIALDSRLTEVAVDSVSYVNHDGVHTVPATGPVVVSQSTTPVNPAVAPPGREAALSRTAGVPVVLAGTVLETAAPIVSTATKSGFDAAQRLAHRIAVPEDISDPLSTAVLT